jgi:hypothetical protein
MRALQETARLFGLGRYGAMGWCCHGVESKIATDRKFKGEMKICGPLFANKKI